MFWKGWSRKERGLCLGVLWTRPERHHPHTPSAAGVCHTVRASTREAGDAACQACRRGGERVLASTRSLTHGGWQPPLLYVCWERKGLWVSSPPTPSRRKRLEWQTQEDSFSQSMADPDLLSVQSILGNRVPLGGRGSQSSFLEPPRITEKDCDETHT